MTLRELLERNVSKHPDKIYVYFEDRQVGYEDFDHAVNRVGNGLLRLGIKKGERVAFMMQNCLEFLFCQFACAKIGAVYVPINIAYKGEETKYLLNHSEAATIIFSPIFLEVIRGIRKDCSHLRNIICVSEEPIPDATLFSELVDGVSSEPPPVDVSKDDTLSIIYTSGTTGRPKGVVLTQGAYASAAGAYNRSVGLTSEDRPMAILPLFHINAQLYFAVGAMDLGTGFVLVDRFSSSKFWDQVHHYQVTTLAAPGAVVRMLYSMPESDQDADNPIRAFVAAAIPLDIYGKFEDRFRLKLVEGYTLTESPSALMNRPGEVKPGSMGKPMPGLQVKIFNEEDKEVLPGVAGEIVIRGPAVMKEYFKNPEATEEAFRNGWLHTGDSGRMDEEGYFYFVDRVKDIVRRSGENISSRDVEEALNSHPKIRESAIIPVPDPIRGEEVKAYVVLEPNEALPPEEIIVYCEGKIASFKVPRYIEYREGLPKTPTLRIKKYVLKKEKEDLTAGCYDRLAESQG